MTEASVVVDLRGASRTLPTGRALFSSFDLEVRAHETHALMGRSGAGKTTLLTGLGLIDRFDEGTYLFGGRELNNATDKAREQLRRRSIGFVYQRFALIGHLTALENVMVPLRHLGYHRSVMRRRATQSLRDVGMESHAAAKPDALSGGEQQRVAIARALVIRPTLVLADEPTGALDQETSRGIIDLLVDNARTRGAALVVVTHDSAVAARLDHTHRLEPPAADGTA